MGQQAKVLFFVSDATGNDGRILERGRNDARYDSAVDNFPVLSVGVFLTNTSVVEFNQIEGKDGLKPILGRPYFQAQTFSFL